MSFQNFVAIILVCLTTHSFAQTADSIYINGDVYTSDARQPWAEAIAVSNDKFVFVGDEINAQDFADENTAIFDLDGRMVIPGLIDAHTHPGMVALTVGHSEFEYAYSKPELLQSIADMVAANPDKELLMGGFWSNDVFDERGPHKSDLDAIESERPVILYDDWGHSVWANSRALEMAGVDEGTEDIVPGFSFYQRDDSGEATGWITESAASVFVNNFQSVTPQVEQSILGFLTYLRDLGVTTVFDGGNFGLDEQILAAVSRLDKAGKLPVRYHGSFTLFLPQDVDSAVARLQSLNDQFGSENVRIDTLKIFHDGVIETRTADMFEDYLDTPGNSGSSLLNQEQIHRLILELSEARLNLHIHSVGNKSTNTILNAVEQAHQTLSGPPPIRIAICHLEVVQDSDFNRFKDLGVIASFTPHWHGADGDDGLVDAIGESANEMMRGQPMIGDAGVVTFSSDVTDKSEWNSHAASPYVGMQIGHNRQSIEGGADAPFSKPRSERLPLDVLLRGYTIHAAYQLKRANELGSLQVGNRADFVVLNQNLLEADRYDIHKTRPDAVIMDGKLVSGTLQAE